MNSVLLRTGPRPLLRRFPPCPAGRRLFPVVFAAARDSSSSAASSLPWSVSIAEHGISLTPKSAATAPKRSTFHNLWLRDSCRCEKCVNQDTLQRNFNTFDLPKDLAATKAESAADGLKVTWNDGHESSYPWSFIQFYQSNDARESEDVKPKFWGAEIISGPETDFEAEGISLDSATPSSIPGDRAPAVPYSDVMGESEPGIGRLTKYIRKFGFAFVTGTPPTPEATEKALERIAFIRITHYGGFYDFIPDLAMADTAYTNIALPAHTDTTYFSDPAGLQAFHMLSHTAHPDPAVTGNDGNIGGESLLVDGFHAAAILKQENPEAYDVLSKVRLPWHASGNKGINIAPDMRYPVLELHPQTGELHRVRWNNDDRGIVPFDGPVSPEKWFAAAKHWQSILRRKEMELWTQLTPGKILIFDNWRVLHGRAAFVGIRRICGGYTNRDDFMSRWRNTNYLREDIMKQVVG